MRRICIIFLYLISGYASAQTSKPPTAPATSSAKPAPTIILDPAFGTIDKPLPIDSRFFLEVDSLKIDRTSQVSVYRVKKEDGVFVFADLDKTNTYPASFMFGPKDINFKNNKVILHFPAIKPEQAFDVFIFRKFTPANLKKVMAMNLTLEPFDAKGRADTTTLKNETDLDKQLHALADSVNNADVYGKSSDPKNSRMQTPKVFAYNLTTFKTTFFDPEIKYYQLLFPEDYPKAANLYVGWAFLTAAQIKVINENCRHFDAMYNHLYPLQRVIDDKTTASAIVKGLLPLNYNYPLKYTKTHDPEQRLKNLTASAKYLDSLQRFTASLKERQIVNADDVDKTVRAMVAAIDSNQSIIQTQLEAIKKDLLKSNREALWLSGSNTKSTDLQTVSKRHVTLDIGVTDLFAYNNQGQVKSIPKLFFGVNVFFRGLDKNIDPGDIKKFKERDCYSHSLETQNLFWTRFSLTAGVTIGKISTPDFSNVLGNYSFTLGPSYQFFHLLRLSAGAAMLNRVNNNPLYANNHVVLGSYISVSLDQDLISAAKSVVDAITK